MKNGLFLKKKTVGGGGRGVIELGHAFMKTPLELSIFFTLPLEIPDKTKLQPWKFHKFLLPTSLGNSKTKNQNPWLEIPHYFFLVTLGNSTLFLINPWKFYMLFLWQFDWYSWKFHILNPSCLVFSRMGQSHYGASTKNFCHA